MFHSHWTYTAVIVQLNWWPKFQQKTKQNITTERMPQSVWYLHPEFLESVYQRPQYIFFLLLLSSVLFGSIKATLSQKVQARIKRLITIAVPHGKTRRAGEPKRAAAADAPPVGHEYILEWRRNSAAATQLSHGQERLNAVIKICIRSAKILQYNPLNGSAVLSSKNWTNKRV